MSKEAKLIRGQVRQIVKEILPDLLKEAVIQELNKEIDKRMEAIRKDTRALLEEMDQRSKDVQSYIVRATSKHVETPIKDKQ